MNIGIMGAGNIAGKMAVTVAEMDDAKIYAVASRDKAKAQEFSGQYQIPNAYGSYRELAEDPEVELVYIATPHSHHYEHAKLCIEHGKPVLCEKAFTANAGQAKELLRLAQEKKVFITEAIWTRYMPSRRLIDEVIQSGRIGEVVSLTANLGYDVAGVRRIWDPALAGGALLDIGVYPLTFACMVLGDDIKEVSAACMKMDSGVDAQDSIVLKYADEKMAALYATVLTATEQYGIVYGTSGYLIAENINNVDKIKIYSPERELLEVIEVPKQITGYEYEVRAAMKAIKEGRIECPEISHREILKMMELMDSIRLELGVKYPFE